ncbi:neurosecretory protein VGF isoform X2 [Thalassophryne amazonica]|uniref:neurosecretory protein VGF isoform X2 n=1 Tax=Thalassophryne amazonica TaxID=390379 RepID=UPI0014717E8C|nr:neurosecretory protein VGF isoform X2 [Thalassophryne amazonica]
MSRYCHVSSALALLVLLTGTSFLPLSTSTPVDTPGDIDSPHRTTPPRPTVSADVEKRNEEGELVTKEGATVEEEDTDELFKDVDPKTLAAVLLEALNWSQAERRREEDWYDGREDIKEAREESREVRMMEGEEKGRDGRQKLDLLMAAQGTEAEERQKLQEEEEKLTEKVTSRTTSQTIQTRKEQQPVTADGREKDTEAAGSLHQGIQNSNEEEEQLSPEELKNLETVMKEFPSLSTVSKRERDSEQSQRSSRGYSAYNNVLVKNKGNDLAMSKKKLKWQEETQKALNFPTFLGGNFMDEFEDNRYAGGNAAVQRPPPEKNVVNGNEAEEEEEEEEELSPEEEEARAKAEQEEMRRQAAEAQRAKLEEEKLADIASDMLLRYMVKQNNGEKKYGSALSNAAEDKRSNEEQEVTEQDIDPQTIDKLIEISSKLHLPADDVVDIISDVEKKKKKDIPSEIISHFRQPVTPLVSPSLLTTTGGFSVPQSSNNQNNFPVFKQPSPGASGLKTWFQDKSPVQSQDRWFKPASQNLWFKPRQPLSVKQDLLVSSPKSVWTSYPPYFHYPSYYQKKPNRDRYPFYFPPPQRQWPRYYFPKPGLARNNFLDSSMDDPYSFPSKHHFYNWVQPRLRKPSSDVQQKSYYTSYSRPLYHQTFQPVPLLKPRPPPQMALLPAQQKQFYYFPPAPAVNKNGDYYGTVVGNRLDNANRDDLKKYIQQILAKQPQMFD